MKRNATIGQLIAGVLGIFCSILSISRADDAGFVLHCGRYRPEWAAEGCPPPPEWVEAHRHFLLADNPGELERPREDWTEKVERRDALLKDIESREGLSASWDEAFFDAASWHYPKGGELEAAQLYFTRKKEWMMRMCGSPEWRHDPAHLDAVADFLGEIREWRFPIGMLWFEDRPGQAILRRAGVESPDDLPAETQRMAYRKAVEEDARKRVLDRLQQTLFSEGNSLLGVGLEHCQRALLAAEKAGETSALQRLSAIKKKMFASAEPPEIFTSSDWADMPDQ